MWRWLSGPSHCFLLRLVLLMWGVYPRTQCLNSRPGCSALHLHLSVEVNGPAPAVFSWNSAQCSSNLMPETYLVMGGSGGEGGTCMHSNINYSPPPPSSHQWGPDCPGSAKTDSSSLFFPFASDWSRCESPFIKEMWGWGRGAARRYCLHQLKERDRLPLSTLPPCIWITIPWGHGSGHFWHPFCTVERSVSHSYVLTDYRQPLSSVSHCVNRGNVNIQLRELHTSFWLQPLSIQPSATCNQAHSWFKS